MNLELLFFRILSGGIQNVRNEHVFRLPTFPFLDRVKNHAFDAMESIIDWPTLDLCERSVLGSIHYQVLPLKICRKK